MEKRETARERERSMGRGEIRVSDSKDVRTEERKVKGREKKWKSLQWEREGAKKSYFLQLQMKIIFIRDVTREREIVFQKKKLENNL